MPKRIKRLEWHGLYDQSWKGAIVPGAFVHPAKYARALIRQIYKYMFEQKWLKEGDTVLDPFGGVALGALDALTMGLNWEGIELESRFVALGNENIALWNSRYAGKLPRWGTARCVQGDSRRLREVITQAGAVMSSPPYASAINPHGEGPGATGERRGKESVTEMAYRSERVGYGTTPGQLAALREGELRDALVSSPPYAGARVGDECGAANVGHGANYGETFGQLGSMPEGVQDVSQESRRKDVEALVRGVGDDGNGNRRAIEGASSVDQKMDEVLRNKRKKTGRQIRRQLQGRPLDPGLSTVESAEREMRIVPADGETPNPPQRLRPLQQQSSQPTSSLHVLPSDPSQESVLGRVQEGREPTTFDCSLPLEMGEEAQAVGSPKETTMSTAQLANMPEGVISSPPFQNQIPSQANQEWHQKRKSIGKHNTLGTQSYGSSPAQLGAMREGSFDASVSSPPYEGSEIRGGAELAAVPIGKRWREEHRTVRKDESGYGNGDGQLGGEQGETFWGAARVIIAECYAALAPGAHAAWVLKAFVRNKQIVDFPQQWQTLCESVGFQTVAIARAWQTKDDGTQLATDGNHKRLTKEKKGFFRRLHEKKYPDTRIDYEIVLFQVKR